jgi:RNA polymerase sigma-70 factor (ECF subfamily)
MVAQSALEKDVIALAQRGDREAFTEIYQKHSQRVFRHIYYLIGDIHEADDLTNETFLRAWKVLDKYEDRGLPIENWLLKIGHNLGARHLKKRRPTQDIEKISLEDSPERLPERLAEVACDVETVRAAVLQLPDLPRQVIIWRFLEGMSYDEVKLMLGKTNGAIRVIQFRALKQLRGILEAMEETSDAANSRDSSHGLRNASTTQETSVPDLYRSSARRVPGQLSPLAGAPPLA